MALRLYKMQLTILSRIFRMKKGFQFREDENTSISDYVYKRDIYSLVGNQRITRTLHLLCQKRDIYIEDRGI